MQSSVETETGSRYLTLTDVASKLGCGYWTVRAMVKRGVIPGIRLGNKILVEQGKLEDLLEAAQEVANE